MITTSSKSPSSSFLVLAIRRPRSLKGLLSSWALREALLRSRGSRKPGKASESRSSPAYPLRQELSLGDRASEKWHRAQITATCAQILSAPSPARSDSGRRVMLRGDEAQELRTLVPLGVERPLDHSRGKRRIAASHQATHLSSPA